MHFAYELLMIFREIRGAIKTFLIDILKTNARIQLNLAFLARYSQKSLTKTERDVNIWLKEEGKY